MKKRLLNILMFLYLLPGLAQAGTVYTGVGGVATSILNPVSVASDFVHTICLVLGVSFIFASVVKYFEHRRTPLMVTMTTVIFLLIAGLILVALPLLSYYTSTGIPYSLWRS